MIGDNRQIQPIDLPVAPDQIVGVACHDAGATNLIAHWLRDFQGQVLPVLDGPARSIWHQLRPNDQPVDLETAVFGCNVMITGTGWQSDLEHNARTRAVEMGRQTIGVVDHWTNYRARFQRNHITILPDEIWVADSYAREIAENCLPEPRIRQLENAYLATVVEEIHATVAKPRSDQSTRLLYVLEPIRSSWPGAGDTPEHACIQFLMDNLGAITDRDFSDLRILLRPHPSEDAAKYDQWEEKYGNIRLDRTRETSLSFQIANADFVAGAESYALVLAVAAGKPTISTLPPAAHRCRLPHKEIMHLRDLVDAREPK